MLKGHLLPNSPAAETTEGEAQIAATVEPTPTPVFMQGLSTSTNRAEALARHGLIIALLIPALVIGIPAFISEFMLVR